MALFHHFSELSDPDRIVNDVYPILLKLLGHEVDAVIEWQYQAEVMRFTYKWNYRIPGHQSGEMLPMENFISLVHPEDFSDLQKSFKRFVESDEKVFFFKCRFVFPDNQVIYVELMSASLSDSTGRPEKFIMLIKDYTGLQHANEEVRELTLAIENAMSGIAWLDAEGNFQMVRNDYAKILGYRPDELIGKSYTITVAPSDRDLAYEAYLKMLKDGKLDIDLTALRKDGTTFHKNILMIKTFNPAGNHSGHYCLMKDITGQVYYERAIRKQNEELKKINLELDNLVYRVSHDLRAPVASSKGLNDLIKKSNDLSEISNYVQLQQQSLERLDRLIKDILLYSYNSRKEVACEEIYLPLLIQEIVDESANGSQVQVSIRVSAKVPLWSDSQRLKIILKNIVSNSIAFQDTSKEKRWVSIHAEITASHLQINFEDNGVGIDPAIGHRIFEMFFRGNEHSKGAGIGLYIAKETVSKLSGTITWSSEIGVGSIFTVIIPNRFSSLTVVSL